MSNAQAWDNTGWHKTTWDGARREALRRWSQLPLERIIAAIEEMEDIADALHPERKTPPDDSNA